MKKDETKQKHMPKAQGKLKKDKKNASETPASDGAQEQEEALGTDIKGEKTSPEEKLMDELAESKDKYLRLYSEFENYRRRTAKEKLEMMQTASERLIVALLPVLDDFGRAEQSQEKEDELSVQEGMKLIASKFRKIVESEGLKVMDTGEGATFDPELHDAITQIPVPKKKLKGKIVDTIESGYFLGDKVIRHAKVVIGA